MGRCDETNYLAWLTPCSKSLTDHDMIKMMLSGSCVCYFAIPSMCYVKHGSFHHMFYFQVYYERCTHTHMLHLCWLPKLMS